MPDPQVAVPGPASDRDPDVAFCKGGAATCEICVGSCGIEEYEEQMAAPGPASVSPADTPESESDRMLLVALGMLMYWGVVRYEANMGGGWFSASEMGTHPIRADEVRRRYVEERKVRDGF